MKTMKRIFSIIFPLVLAFLMAACEPPFVDGTNTNPTPPGGTENGETPPPPQDQEQPAVKPDPASGITFDPALPNADEPCRIIFKQTLQS